MSAANDAICARRAETRVIHGGGDGSGTREATAQTRSDQRDGGRRRRRRHEKARMPDRNGNEHTRNTTSETTHRGNERGIESAGATATSGAEMRAATSSSDTRRTKSRTERARDDGRRREAKAKARERPRTTQRTTQRVQNDTYRCRTKEGSEKRAQARNRVRHEPQSSGAGRDRVRAGIKNAECDSVQKSCHTPGSAGVLHCVRSSPSQAPRILRPRTPRHIPHPLLDRAPARAPDPKLDVAAGTCVVERVPRTVRDNPRVSDSSNPPHSRQQGARARIDSDVPGRKSGPVHGAAEAASSIRPRFKRNEESSDATRCARAPRPTNSPSDAQQGTRDSWNEYQDSTPNEAKYRMGRRKYRRNCIALDRP